jgi:hypothetical protein
MELKPTDLILRRRTDLGFTRDRHIKVRKSARADLRCAVSKDGRWLGLAWGPSFETRAILRGARHKWGTRASG